MKEILVIGGGGFIGRNIVESLVQRGDCNVTAADLNEGSNWREISSDTNKTERFKAVIDDFTRYDAFEKLNQNFDEIYMMAALVGVNLTLKSPQEVIRINTKLTMNTLDWISRNPVKRLLFASSSENYASTSDLIDIEIPTSEKVPLCIADIKHPRWTYAMTKIHGESAFYHSAGPYGYESVIIRYQNIIGPEMGFGHAIPHIVERFFNDSKSPFKIYGSNQTRAFCYIDDAIDGTIAAMEEKNASNQIYHLGKPEEITMDSLTKYIGKLMNYSGDYQPAITYPGSVHRRCPNINKAIKDFNYDPKVSWKLAVRLTVEWYKKFFESGNIPINGGFEPPENVMTKIER
jgi:UDP-glucose 4-epimerase